MATAGIAPWACTATGIAKSTATPTAAAVLKWNCLIRFMCLLSCSCRSSPSRSVAPPQAEESGDPPTRADIRGPQEGPGPSLACIGTAIHPQSNRSEGLRHYRAGSHFQGDECVLCRATGAVLLQDTCANLAPRQCFGPVMR